MSQTTNRPYHHGDLRRAIINTAMEMLYENKNWQFTLREVARRAGVSHTAPYKHFTDKSSLLAEISLIGFDQLKEKLTDSISGNNDVIQHQIYSMANSYMQFAVNNSGLYRLMFSTDTQSNSELHLSDRALSALGVFVELLERGQKEGKLRKRDVRGQVAACWALMHGFAMLNIDGMLLPEKVGDNALENGLVTLLEGLQEP